MKINAMHQADIVALLESYSFEGLLLTKTEGKTSTYKFANVKLPKLAKLGVPVMAGDGKVAVYTIPNVCRIGLTDDRVRVVLDKVDTAIKTSDKHLGYVKVPDELTQAFFRAQGAASTRLRYCYKLWDFLNHDKFEGRLDRPRIQVLARPTLRNARGVYYGGVNFGTGRIEIWDKLFNAREPFFLEVFLHEICHQAVWTLDRVSDRTEKGHGPNWKAWMRKVGLDPRRFDPTDDTEYEDTVTKVTKDAALNTKYGPRATKAQLDSLVRTMFRTGTPCSLVFNGRIFTGEFTGKNFAGYDTTGKYPISLGYKSTSIVEVYLPIKNHPKV